MVLKDKQLLGGRPMVLGPLTDITANNRVMIFASWQLKFTAKFHFSEIIFG